MHDSISAMILYNDTEKALPNEKLLSLFRAVGWTTEQGEEAHLHHFNAPFCGSSFVVSAWDGDTLVGCARVLSDGAECVFLRRECPMFG